MTARKVPAEVCANPACQSTIYEGQQCLFDHWRDLAFCGGHCFDDWFRENHDKLAVEYRRLNLTYEEF